ncbi:zinc finger CCCH domain-containing protein 19-like [Histomonas meleagridis]|uniref:zinc finger CCCH domain-containing protein 19-like n=1 Tax=Histomonas meleagridis TaxID=135588 RepID=UPI003559E4ED|nr:zinc finger CCCH domain-containing protein 19-like [Histomonas meleagridis]KAH0804376.1 zinc finger CCCH domain-containing protein 19-like [Histomonas meleagridis]
MNASIKYTRDQLLAIFNQNLPFPEGANRIQKVILNEPRIPALLQQQTLKYRSNKPNHKKIKADISPTNTVPTQPAQPVIQNVPVSTPMAWFYRDPTGKIQGPFKMQKLREWWENKLFPTNLMISTNGAENSFHEVSYYFKDISKAFLYNPILFPFLGPVSPQEGDILQDEFIKFENSFSQQ